MPDDMTQVLGPAVPTTLVADPAVSLSLLGSFEIHCHGRPVGLPKTAQRVVAFLGLHRRLLSRAQVAGSLWAESPDERAGASLRSALWRLGASGWDLVLATPQTLMLSPTVAVDHDDAVRRAHRLLGWEDLADQGRPLPAADERLDWTALSAELLPGWYEDWVIIERERFNKLRLHALEALCLALAEAGRFGPAVEAGHAAVAADPLRESAHRCLVRAYLAEGNRADALRQYKLYRKFCNEELDCAPSAAFEALVLPLRT
jgi:DNA-binding SARP family transcriptional activator